MFLGVVCVCVCLCVVCVRVWQVMCSNGLAKESWPRTDFTGSDLPHGDNGRDHAKYRHMKSLYFTFTASTTIGFGDMSPARERSRALASTIEMVLVLFGVVILSYAIDLLVAIAAARFDGGLVSCGCCSSGKAARRRQGKTRLRKQKGQGRRQRRHDGAAVGLTLAPATASGRDGLCGASSQAAPALGAAGGRSALPPVLSPL